MREQNPRRLPLLLLGVVGRLKPSIRWEEPLQGRKVAMGGLLGPGVHQRGATQKVRAFSLQACRRIHPSPP